jgi:hypothetical protein
MSIRLIPPGEMDAILLVVGPGLVGEREDMLLVVTPGLDITFGSAAFWDGSAFNYFNNFRLQIWIFYVAHHMLGRENVALHMNEASCITFAFLFFWDAVAEALFSLSSIATFFYVSKLKAPFALIWASFPCLSTSLYSFLPWSTRRPFQLWRNHFKPQVKFWPMTLVTHWSDHKLISCFEPLYGIVVIYKVLNVKFF